jgi:biopolymer transport protein ExbD
MSHPRVRRLRKRAAELDITAFMNLIVVLVPFLLSTAVFSRLAILELNLPAQSSGFSDLKGELQLEIIIRQDALVVADRLAGQIQRIDPTAQGHDFPALSRLMQQLKAKFPDKNEATILAEPNTPYDVLVQTMDAVRVAKVLQAGSVTTLELFPEVSVGDAPVPGAPAAPTPAKARKKS